MGKAGLVALGGIGLTGLARPAAAEAAPAPGKWRIAVVNHASGSQVSVDGGAAMLPVEGFPAGWEFRAGDKVAVGPSLEGAGLVAFPVAHWVPAEAAPAAMRPGARLAAGGTPEVTAATELTPALAAERAGRVRAARSLRIAVADRVSKVGPDRALAIREE